ncbi:unnamed protein product [Caenorhabditis brenneri]
MAKNGATWRDFGEPGANCVAMNNEDFGLYFSTDDRAYVSNLSMLTKEEKQKFSPKYFMLGLDKSNPIVKRPPVASLVSLRVYSENSTDPVLIRAFPVGQNRHVLTEDILEIIPIVMKKQGKPLKLYYKKLQNYRNAWSLDNPKLTNSVSVAEFKSVMEGFKVKKDLITIVPDVVHKETSIHMLRYGTGPVSIQNRDGTIVIEPSQALFLMFKSLVCGRKWDRNGILDKDEMVLPDFYKEYEKVSAKYKSMIEGTLIALEEVLSDIAKLQNHKIFTENFVGPQEKLKFEEYSAEGKIPIDVYKGELEKYQLNSFKCVGQHTEIPVIEARLRIILEFIEDFWIPQWIGRKMSLMEGFLYIVPEKMRKAQRERMIKNWQEIENQYEDFEEEEEFMNTPSSSKTDLQAKTDARKLLNSSVEKKEGVGYTVECDSRLTYLLDVDEKTGQRSIIDLKKLRTIAELPIEGPDLQIALSDLKL